MGAGFGFLFWAIQKTSFYRLVGINYSVLSCL